MTDRDKIEATLTGVVKEAFNAATGLALTLELLRENAKYPDKVTVWGVQTMHSVGDKVRVDGILSWGTKTTDAGKRFFNVNINDATVVTLGTHQAAETITAGWPTAQPANEQNGVLL